MVNIGHNIFSQIPVKTHDCQHTKEINQIVEYLDRCEKYGIPEFRNMHTSVDIIDHMYEKFGKELIHSLPTNIKIYNNNSQVSVISGTKVWHSVTDFSYKLNQIPGDYFIFDRLLTFEQWIVRSALSPEEQLIYRLKRG